MDKGLITLERPEVPDTWDYKTSVDKVKAFVYKWKNITAELVTELYIAREKLSAQGFRTDLTSGQKSQSWSQYCKDIGTQKRVVNRWLKQYFESEAEQELIEAGKTATLPATVEIKHGDFIESDVAPNSVDLILTDPPYPGEFIEVWTGLADFAVKVLKPSGFLVAYSGQFHLPEVIFRINEFEELQYYWTFCLYHTGATQIVNARNLMCKWKPILVFQKLPFKKLENTFPDYVISEKEEKFGHEWQQSESGAATLVEYFTNKGDTICDPFCGSGTFPYVAHTLGRSSIGIDIEEDNVLKSKGRFK